jgi:hypothetical protein
MKNFRKYSLSGLVWLLFALGFLFEGCNADPRIVPISLESPVSHVSSQPMVSIQAAAGMSIGLRQFTDSRRDTAILGAKSSRWGTLDSCLFTIKGGDLGRSTAKALSRYLKGAGWQVRMVEPGDAMLPALLVSGEIIEMHVDAASNLLSTHVTTSVILLVEERDRKTGKRSSTKLSQADSKNVFWFDSTDAEALLKESLTKVFRQWTPGAEWSGHMVGSGPRAY